MAPAALAVVAGLAVVAAGLVAVVRQPGRVSRAGSCWSWCWAPMPGQPRQS
ncbi:hypothetical protein [Synechococcus sp. HK01-R]|uniref:hypothetical protein n=1 Tax=Synechococcus sp. HK01-R TaxID=2751171 RepID=UPI00162521FF|nr:hypothetical protein [Synechococcus sp. HK01-R]QNG26083.1 hypothetical protein H0O21_07125 [Synechococcus sp. HK01-R]